MVRRDQQPSRPHIVFLFQVRFRLIRLPVVRKPLSPMAPRHSIDNWPRVARPSRRRSFCRASMPSVRDSSCSIRKATWRTSRGLRVGGFAVEGSEDVASQLRDWHLKGGLGLSRVCLGVLADGSIFCFQISASSVSFFGFLSTCEELAYLYNHRTVPHILQLRFQGKPKQPSLSIRTQ